MTGLGSSLWRVTIDGFAWVKLDYCWTMLRVFVTTFFFDLPLAESGAGDAAYWVLNLSWAGIETLRDSHGSKIALGAILCKFSGLVVELKSVALDSVYLAVLLLRTFFCVEVISFFSAFFALVLAVDYCDDGSDFLPRDRERSLLGVVKPTLLFFTCLARA